MSNSVKLVSVTPDAEALLARMARVSSSNPENPEYSKLLKYLIEHKHWSPFEMVHMVVHIETSRAIAAQILRHRSFSFQELSQRYTSDIAAPAPVSGRKQELKNRQSSVQCLDTHTEKVWQLMQQVHYRRCQEEYEDAIKLGVAREQARMLLPLATPTCMYMAGSIRSWIHYLELRTKPDTQQEHRGIAEAVQKIFSVNFPVTSEVLGWTASIEKNSVADLA